MNRRIVDDITNFIFITDAPRKIDTIFLLGGSHPEQTEYAAQLCREEYSSLLIPSGGLCVKREKWPGVRSKADVS